MEKKCGIFVVKRLDISNILNFISTFEKYFGLWLDLTEFLKMRTGLDLDRKI